MAVPIQSAHRSLVTLSLTRPFRRTFSMPRELLLAVAGDDARL